MSSHQFYEEREYKIESTIHIRLSPYLEHQRGYWLQPEREVADTESYYYGLE
jgi:hypothetical protein